MVILQMHYTAHCRIKRFVFTKTDTGLYLLKLFENVTSRILKWCTEYYHIKNASISDAASLQRWVRLHVAKLEQCLSNVPRIGLQNGQHHKQPMRMKQRRNENMKTSSAHETNQRTKTYV